MALLSSLGGSAALLGVACGRPAALQPIDQASGNAAGDSLGQTAELDSAGYDLDTSAGPLAATSGPACITRSGDFSDSDGDGVPTDGTITFTDCSRSATLNGYTFQETLNGTVEIKDPTPAVDDPGVFDEADQLKYDRTITSSAGTVVYSSEVQDSGSVEGSVPNPGIYQRKVDKNDTETRTVFGQTHSGSSSRSWKLDYTPGSAWQPGQPMVKGLVSISGTFDLDIDAHSLDGVVSTPVALTVDPACPTRVTAGELKAVETDGSHSRTVDVQWSACGQRTVTVTIN